LGKKSEGGWFGKRTDEEESMPVLEKEAWEERQLCNWKFQGRGVISHFCFVAQKKEKSVNFIYLFLVSQIYDL